MKLRRFTKREKAIFIFCCVLVFVFVNYFCLYVPLKKFDKSVMNQIESFQKKLDDNAMIIRQELAFESEYASLQDGYRQKESDESEMADILNDIGVVAEKTVLEIADMKPKKVKKTAIFKEYSVELIFEADLVNILHFIHLLQNAPYSYDVDELYLEKTASHTTRLRCQLAISQYLIP